MKHTESRRRSHTTFRPRLETLETRLTPTTYTVSSLADSGAGSLRAAITSVNADNTLDEIDFSVAGVIQLTSGALPAITNTVKIEGTTEIRGSMATGFFNSPVVELDNNGFDGLTINASNSTLSSLSIVNSGSNEVTLEGDNITVVGNWIGLPLDESVAPNSRGGLSVDNSTGDIIGGTASADRNVISGNGMAGIELGSSATVEGNFIGTDPTGQLGAGDQGIGILIYGNGNTIGGTKAGAGNVIADSVYGIYFSGGSGNAIIGNSFFDNSNPIELNGANQNQPAPTLLFATLSGLTTQIAGILDAEANTAYSVQIYAGSPPDEGHLLLGTVSATTDANGFAAFTLEVQTPANVGLYFTALATSPSNNTSQFSPGIGVSSTANEAFVASAYGFLLHRGVGGGGGLPSDAGSLYWVSLLNQGAPPAQVLLGIQGSAEYSNDQVTAMYQLYLQRAPDSGGAQYWLNFLEAGGTFEQVAEGLTSSQEYFNLQGGTNQGFITGLYHEVLNRTPSAAEVAGWEAVLNAGNSRLYVSVAYFLSQEYRTDLVQDDYTTFLLRPADPAGLAAWVNALNNGYTDQEVLAGTFGSPEGYQLWS
jgi:hypothetical protein